MASRRLVDHLLDALLCDHHGDSRRDELLQSGLVRRAVDAKKDGVAPARIVFIGKS